jgi:hypothetical protein
VGVKARLRREWRVSSEQVFLKIDDPTSPPTSSAQRDYEGQEGFDGGVFEF